MTREQLQYRLKEARKEQVTDIYAPFEKRIGRYVEIQLIKYTLNVLIPKDHKK